MALRVTSGLSLCACHCKEPPPALVIATVERVELSSRYVDGDSASSGGNGSPQLASKAMRRVATVQRAMRSTAL